MGIKVTRFNVTPTRDGIDTQIIPTELKACQICGRRLKSVDSIELGRCYKCRQGGY